MISVRRNIGINTGADSSPANAHTDLSIVDKVIELAHGPKGQGILA